LNSNFLLNSIFLEIRISTFNRQFSTFFDISKQPMEAGEERTHEVTEGGGVGADDDREVPQGGSGLTIFVTIQLPTTHG
jgi:hypothetical protein